MDDPSLTSGRTEKESELSVHHHAPAGCVCRVADTDLELMPERLAWWPAEKILLFADSHFGKAATFRKAGLPVPAGTTTRMLEVLSGAIATLQPARLVILGDFIHSVTQARVDFERELMDWRLAHASLAITLVLGNHDRHRRPLFRQLRLDVCDEEACGPLHFCHDPFAGPAGRADRFWLGGHIHPSIRLGNDRQRIPCFWQSENFLVFPAFGAFTGVAAISPGHQDILFPISDGQIAKVFANTLTALPRGPEMR